MNKTSVVLGLSGVVLWGNVSAGTMGLAVPDSAFRWVGSLSGGPVWSKTGETQGFYLTPEIEKTYVAYKSSKALASGELFLGGQKSLSGDWLGQIGLALGLAGHAKAQGVIWDDADPQFDNHAYAYKVLQSRVAVKGKLLKECSSWLTPWVSGSAGIGFNRAYGFSNTPLIFEALPNPNFTNHTKTAFTYTLGAGVQKSLNEHWQLGVGYEFADWGKSELGRAAGQSLNSGLKLNQLYTNGVLVNVTYVS